MIEDMSGKPLPIELVYAVARNGVIGRDNAMPWNLPSDLRHFKAVTMGNPVVMGRRTFESIGRPLQGRKNIVVTHRTDYAPEGVTVVGSPDDAVELARRVDGGRAVSVIGGSQIYRELLPRADRLIVTHVDAEPEGDTFMPPVDDAVWKRVSYENGEPHPDDTDRVTFAVYERR